MSGIYGLVLLNSSSETESDDTEEEMLFYSLMKKKFKSLNKFILSKRKNSGQFTITTKISDADFTNYFRMNRNQCAEVHEMIRQGITPNPIFSVTQSHFLNPSDITTGDILWMQWRVIILIPNSKLSVG
ncbi:unnamed protein product [Psylliodes chrysocephalus]|uniref:Uncharacterized protein n=1 Tax=Psylliodes chrysocephalus TaxID=3402493 RepID=A0A9P0CUK9_9CUCU|nr:unnamed protein product [Psylliodes chrysocephala]